MLFSKHMAIDVMRLFATYIFLYLISANAWACSHPQSGDKYNRQIQIVSLEEKGQYQFSIPSEMEGANKLVVMLGYSRTYLNDIRLLEEYEELNFEVVDKNATGIFTVSNKQGMKPYLHVKWWPKLGGVCGIVANSDFIE